MSDRIAVLRDGAVVQVGTPVELYERPAGRYTAEFLGESNIFTGRTHGVDDGSVLVVRPEHVQLSSAGSGLPSGHRAVEGVVREVVYLGSGLRVEVALPDGRHLVTRSAVRGGLTPSPGLPVAAHWHPEHALVVHDDTAA